MPYQQFLKQHERQQMQLRQQMPRVQVKPPVNAVTAPRGFPQAQVPPLRPPQGFNSATRSAPRAPYPVYNQQNGQLSYFVHADSDGATADSAAVYGAQEDTSYQEDMFSQWSDGNGDVYEFNADV